MSFRRTTSRPRGTISFWNRGNITSNSIKQHDESFYWRGVSAQNNKKIEQNLGSYTSIEDFDRKFQFPLRFRKKKKKNGLN